MPKSKTLSKIKTYLMGAEVHFQDFSSVLNLSLFNYCDGKRKKIRWLKVQYSISMGFRRNENYCYKPIALVTPKILSIVNETFTPSPKGFKISVTL